jgi:nucleoid-associated protein YgaU
MTSEAKIGLLLGLVFIFIIAFIINGLPSFWNKSDSSEVAVATESQEDTAVGIGVNERKAGEAIERIEPGTAVNSSGVVVETQGSSDVRFVAEPPKGVTNASANAELKPAAAEQASPAELREQSSDIQSSKPAEQRTYVVCEGDSLYTIAKKFYGVAAAGKKTTTNLIFNANRNILKSPDTLYIGQKLIIPQLTDTQTKKSRVENVAVSTAKTQTTESAHAVAAGDGQTKSTREYVVQSGDSLWKIAANNLGNGSRYEEIAELNADVLNGDDNLTVGMRLKLPAR